MFLTTYETSITKPYNNTLRSVESERRKVLSSVVLLQLTTVEKGH